MFYSQVLSGTSNELAHFRMDSYHSIYDQEKKRDMSEREREKGAGERQCEMLLLQIIRTENPLQITISY